MKKIYQSPACKWLRPTEEALMVPVSPVIKDTEVEEQYGKDWNDNTEIPQGRNLWEE